MNIHITNIQKSEIFTSIFQHIRLFTEHINITFSKERMYLQSMDSSRVSIFELILPAEWFDIYDFDKYSEISVPNMKYDKEKLKQINKYKHQYIHGVIHKLDEISNIFQKIGKSLEYFIHYLKESQKILLNNYKDENNDEEIKLLLSYIIKNLYNIIFLELNNLYLNNKKLEYITLENLNIYLIPKIDLLFDEYKINIDITENNRLYKFEVGYNCIECNNEQNIYNILDEAKEIYIYFNTRYNILSSIINQLKLK